MKTINQIMGFAAFSFMMLSVGAFISIWGA